MSRALAVLVAVGLSIVAPRPAAAQVAIFQRPGGQPIPPARDASAAKTGTAKITGRVTAADSGQPLRKAQVRVVAAEIRENRSTSTDGDGKFEFKDLPAGRYQVTVSKGSFVTLQYGQSRPFEAGKPLQIADGQVVEKVDFALPRGAIITGHVSDEFGEPIADVRVAPMRYQYVQGRRQLNPAGRVSTTNDIGEFRIFGLAPGQYFISASTQANFAAGILDSGASDDRSGYAPSYYPGTPNVAEAQRITVGLGQTLNDINLALTPTRLARMSGTATDADGKPMAGAVVVVMMRSGASISNTSGTQVKPDGTFTVANLAPGDYMIQAISPSAITDMSGWASGQVTIAGEDVTGVLVTGARPTSGTGRVIVNGDAKALTPNLIHLMATPAHPEDNLFAGIGGVTVKDDYSFELKARPGLAIIRAVTLPPGWALKSVRQRGTDVTDSGIEFRQNEEASGIEVELTNQATEVSGAVTNARSEPVKDYTVVVFSRERERWGYMSRFFQTGRPDQDGRFKVKSLPAGNYYAVALDYVEPGEASDPEFLDRVKERAVTFSLGDGEAKTIDLKIATSSSH
jgi:hypothetical protein